LVVRYDDSVGFGIEGELVGAPCRACEDVRDDGISEEIDDFDRVVCVADLELVVGCDDDHAFWPGDLEYRAIGAKTPLKKPPTVVICLFALRLTTCMPAMLRSLT
jgi:hypothetical protein